MGTLRNSNLMLWWRFLTTGSWREPSKDRRSYLINVPGRREETERLLVGGAWIIRVHQEREETTGWEQPSFRFHSFLAFWLPTTTTVTLEMYLSPGQLLRSPIWSLENSLATISILSEIKSWSCQSIVQKPFKALSCQSYESKRGVPVPQWSAVPSPSRPRSHTSVPCLPGIFAFFCVSFVPLCLHVIT